MRFLFFIKVLKCISELGGHNAVFNSSTWNVWQTFNISVSHMLKSPVQDLPDFLVFAQQQLSTANAIVSWGFVRIEYATYSILC